MYPSADIDIRWADEALFNTCGYMHFKNAQITDEYYPDFSEDMIEFYCKVHDLDIEEFKEDIGWKDTETEETEPSFISDEERAKLEKDYPQNSRILLEHMSDTTNPVNDMTRGTVQGINETGGINVIFDDQSIATVIPGVDNFRPLTVEEAIAEAIPFDRNLDIDELSNQIITFYRDFDPYDFDDIYSEEDPSKPFNDVKGYVQDADEITALKSYFKENILPKIIQQ